MKKIYFTFITISFLLACKEFESDKPIIKNKILQTEKTSEVEVEMPIITFNIDTHLIKYNKLKKRIVLKRSEIVNQTNKTDNEKRELAERYVSSILIDSIFEYWEGTKWDFNGYTETPRKGEVACGYYVSTTLRDVGLNINRYKVAQKAAAAIIKSLSQESSIKTISGFSDTKQFLQGLEDYEIVVVGLDFHVGFVFKKDNKLYFSHSNYIDREGVIKELLDNSVAFKNSNSYVVGKLTKDSKFLKNWLNNN